jgi:peptidyl-dipeptidase Dcp
MPAFKKGILELRADIAAILENPEPPTFENTILALEIAGELLTKVDYTFGNITNTELNDELRALESEVNPMLTREFDAINLNTDLYARVKAVYDQKASRVCAGRGRADARGQGSGCRDQRRDVRVNDQVFAKSARRDQGVHTRAHKG